MEGKLAAALRRIGFDKVFDVDTAADMTIMEEGTELLTRMKNGGALPLITSCSPGWVKFCELYYPEFIPNVSSCKSPQQMYGALMKTYYAEKEGIDPKNLYVVSIMPCTAKKFEINREDQAASGYPDLDASLTTRELANMIKRAGIVFEALRTRSLTLPSALPPAQDTSSAPPAVLWKRRCAPCTRWSPARSWRASSSTRFAAWRP